MTIRLPLFLLSFVGGCQSPPPPAREIDGQAAMAYVRAQVGFGPRVPGTDGHRRTSAWLDSLLRIRADSVIVQSWTHISRQGDSLPLKNLVARFNPAAARRVMFLAHWDTRPMADQDTGARAKEPIPGANDGGSGVAVLLAMADALKKAPPTIGVDLLFVDGEDFGVFSEEVDVLLGSKHYAASPMAGPLPEYAVLLDMVGGKGAVFRKEGYSVTAAPSVVDLVWSTASRLGLSNYFLNETGGSITDDHIPLQQAGFKAINVIAEFGSGTTFPYWHTLGDTPDKLAPETLAAVGDVMMALIREAQGRQVNRGKTAPPRGDLVVRPAGPRASLGRMNSHERFAIATLTRQCPGRPWHSSFPAQRQPSARGLVPPLDGAGSADYRTARSGGEVGATVQRPPNGSTSIEPAPRKSPGFRRIGMPLAKAIIKRRTAAAALGRWPKSMRSPASARGCWPRSPLTSPWATPTGSGPEYRAQQGGPAAGR